MNLIYDPRVRLDPITPGGEGDHMKQGEQALAALARVMGRARVGVRVHPSP